MNNVLLLRKELRKILLVQWSRFGAVPIRVSGSTLFVGVNGSGKSTILDALTYLYSGNTQFNIAAKDRDRTVVGYVRGDTRSKGEDQYLRSGNVISYIVMEFFDATENKYITAGVCIESPDIQEYNSFWFIKKDAQINDFNFYKHEDDELTVTPKNALKVNGVKLKSDEFMRKEKGIKALQRMLGLRCDASELRRRLNKMMSFKLENNIDEFIRESVLPEERITTIDSLKEQKHQFEQIKETYAGIRKRKDLLDEIENRTVEYEIKQSELDLKTAILYYQNKVVAEKSFFNDKQELTELNRNKERLLEQETAYNEELRVADKEKSDADFNFRNNDLSAGIDDLKAVIEHQIIEEQRCKSEVEKIRSSIKDIRSLDEICGFDHELLKVINGADTKEYSSKEKYTAFEQVRSIILNKLESLREKRYYLKTKHDETDKKVSDLSYRISELEKNNKDYPKQAKDAKELINSELKAEGYNGQVRFLAELIEDIFMPEWRDAIEVYLGNKRFDLVIDAEYVTVAMEIYHRNKIGFPNLVLSDKLEDVEEKVNSAASILSIPNKYARKYVNYLLGKLYLCNTLEELHEHPRGGIMADGTLAKSYTMRTLDLGKVTYFIGKDAIRLQLEKLKVQRAELVDELQKISGEIKGIEDSINILSAIDIRSGEIDFDAVEKLPLVSKSVIINKQKLEEMQNDPRLTSLKERLDKAVDNFNSINKKIGDIKEEIGQCNGALTAQKEKINNDQLALRDAEKRYDSFILMHLELKRKAIEEYEQASKNRSDGIVLKAETIRRIESDRNSFRSKMEDAQIKYNNYVGKESLERGPSFISVFRRDRDQLVNVDAEDVKNKLEEKQKILESTFIYDFVAEMCEKVTKTKKQIDEINRELKRLPFGQDTYEFKARERSDKSAFFKIMRKIYDKTFGLNEAFLASMESNSEFKRDVDEFMDVILNDTNEKEFADYRYYFLYDMSITNTIGSQNIEADLSEKQGSASNGEKQTPYYIILAASLMQCYPRDVSCARLAFIDEAFAALSQDRIVQMVKYLEKNGFQVLYAAPPEKIKSIGSIIDSTVSLVETGRYTNAVEGLTDEYLKVSAKAN